MTEQGAQGLMQHGAHALPPSSSASSMFRRDDAVAIAAQHARMRLVLVQQIEGQAARRILVDARGDGQTERDQRGDEAAFCQLDAAPPQAMLLARQIGQRAIRGGRRGIAPARRRRRRPRRPASCSRRPCRDCCSGGTAARSMRAPRCRRRASCRRRRPPRAAADARSRARSRAPCRSRGSGCCERRSAGRTGNARRPSGPAAPARRCRSRRDSALGGAASSTVDFIAVPPSKRSSLDGQIARPGSARCEARERELRRASAPSARVAS